MERSRPDAFVSSRPSDLPTGVFLWLGLLVLIAPAVAQADGEMSNGGGTFDCDADQTVIESDEQLAQFASLACPKLSGNLVIRGFDVHDLAGLETISRIEGSLHIKGAHNLSSLEGLENLERVDSDVHLVGNEKFSNLDGLERLETVGADLVIAYHPRLKSLHGLDRLHTVSGALRLTGNPLLADLSALSELAGVGSLTLAYLPRLQKVRGFSEVDVGKGIVLEGNASLEDLGTLTASERGLAHRRLSHNPLLIETNLQKTGDLDEEPEDQ